MEIEFAVNLDMPKGQPKVFSLLQIRPIAGRDETDQPEPASISRMKIPSSSRSRHWATGLSKMIQDFVYVKPESFNAAKSPEIAKRLEGINEQFLGEKKNYVLVGPGRWGSSDPWLGIPVKWPQISAARVIVNRGLRTTASIPAREPTSSRT